jgi:DedD protein
MAKPQDTEITLGTGRMLAIFFTFVLVCAFFFAIGFSLGRRTTGSGIGTALASTGAAPTTIVRPSAAKNDPPKPTSQTGDLGFYDAVGQKKANTELISPEPKTRPSTTPPPSPMTDPLPPPAVVAGSTSPAGTGYFVQVAAVRRQEDADSLVEALKKKQYPAFTTNNPALDKFFHVQVGPFAELKDTEAIRARLVSDGYNPIVKK